MLRKQVCLMVAQTAIAPVEVVHNLTTKDLQAALHAGWQDFIAYPAYGLFFATFYVIGGLGLTYGLLKFGQSWWIIPVIAGFPLLAPFTAVGFYEVSRRRQSNLQIDWPNILGALNGRGDQQLILMGGIVFVAFSYWMIMAHGIFAIFLGSSRISGDPIALLLSYNTLMMLLVGSAVGGVFALGLFAVTVISLPMLVDRDVDFITAIIASLGVVRSNKLIMIGWAALIAMTLSIAMLPLFLGLLVVLPVLGHATWHLYRRAVSQSAI
jgi:uncharacterized membrane protein